MSKKMLLSGNEAIARAALDAGVALGTGYPGTPSSEILEEFANYGGKAQWAPNEKVALEVGIGAAYGHVRSLVTMKHVGVNVAADPLFTIAYSGTPGGLVLVSADDPGMASSQNEQDNRRYAVAAGIPMFEPTDSQDCYDLLFRAFEISEQYRTPVMFRVTTRICHSKCLVELSDSPLAPGEARYLRDVKTNVMIPAYARPAHRRLRERLARLEQVAGDFVSVKPGSSGLGIIANGISYQHCLDAAPDAAIMKLTMTYPLPMERIREFAASVKECFVVEEGDPVMEEAIKAAGIVVEGKLPLYRFGEFNVARVKRLLARDASPEAPPVPGKPPQLCVGCPHRKSYEALRQVDAIVTGDIGCYTLGVLPPFEAVDTCVCMGASITTGLGLRHVLPESEARRVVSVIGDSTFWHTGVNGIVEMIYNRPATGHIVMILDNSTTAMTGLQENPGTGRRLDHSPSPSLDLERTLKGMGVDHVAVIDPVKEYDLLLETLKSSMADDRLTVIIARRPCILAAVKIKAYQEACHE